MFARGRRRKATHRTGSTIDVHAILEEDLTFRRPTQLIEAETSTGDVHERSLANYRPLLPRVAGD